MAFSGFGLGREIDVDSRKFRGWFGMVNKERGGGWGEGREKLTGEGCYFGACCCHYWGGVSCVCILLVFVF